MLPHEVIERAAQAVAELLDGGECPHGLPGLVLSRDPLPGHGGNVSVRPLCDGCVREAVRAVLLERATYPVPVAGRSFPPPAPPGGDPFDADPAKAGHAAALTAGRPAGREREEGEA